LIDAYRYSAPKYIVCSLIQLLLPELLLTAFILTTSFDITLFSKILTLYLVQVKSSILDNFDYRVDFEIALLNYCKKLIN